MLNVRLAGGYLYGKQRFTWLSLVVSLMASFVLSLFPLDVLDEIWDLLSQFLRDFLPTLQRKARRDSGRRSMFYYNYIYIIFNMVETYNHF